MTYNERLKESFKEAIYAAVDLLSVCNLFRVGVYYSEAHDTFVAAYGLLARENKPCISGHELHEAYGDSRENFVRVFESGSVTLLMDEEDLRKYKATCAFYEQYKQIAVQTMESDYYRTSDDFDTSKTDIDARYFIALAVLSGSRAALPSDRAIMFSEAVKRQRAKEVAEQLAERYEELIKPAAFGLD